MSDIETSFRIAYKEGGDIGYYSNKKEFLANIEGVIDSVFNIELLDVGTVFKHQEKELKIFNISVELHGVIDSSDNRLSLSDNTLSKAYVVVVIFVE